MEDKKTNIGIEEIRKIKMTVTEKENILSNVLSTPVAIGKSVPSPYLFGWTIKKRYVAYLITAFCLVIVILGGGTTLTYFQNQKLNNQTIARSNAGKIGTFSEPTLGDQNISNDSVGLNPLTSKPTGGAIAKNTKEIVPNSSSPSVTSMAPNTGSEQSKRAEKTYQGNGFSFNYDAGAKIASGVIPPYGYYAEISTANRFNSIHFYPAAVPANSRSEFFTDTMTIGGKTFYFGEVQTETGIERSFMYKKDEKTIIIQNDSLIDLNSIEIY